MPRQDLISRAPLFPGRIAGLLILGVFLSLRAPAAEEAVPPNGYEAEVASLVAEALSKNPDLLAAR